MIVANQFRRKTENVKLTHAILLYTTAEKRNAVAMLHDVVTPERGSPQLGAGKGISMAAMQDVIYSLLDDGAQQPQFISENIIAMSMTMIAWWKPSHVAPMWVHGKRAKDYTHPALFFVGTPRLLYVWAMKESKRPTAETALYHAPYFNCYSSGIMCQGSAKYPPFITPSAVKVFESAFFETNFTHISNPQGVKHKRGMNGFWADLKGSRQKKIPVQHLVQTNMTVGKVIASLTKTKKEPDAQEFEVEEED